MVQKVIRDRLDAILHWNISLVGGFLGAYAILLHVGNFGSAQTGNLMEMGAELVSMEWFNVLLRLAALVLFAVWPGAKREDLRAPFYGRSYAESPDIDGRIWFTADSEIAPGSFVNVRLTGTMDGETTGELV